MFWQSPLTVSENMKTTANGNLISSQKIKNHQKIETWSEPISYSSYLYGFVIGEFAVVSEKYNSVDIEYIEPLTENPDQKNNLQKTFEKTQKIIYFSEEKSGLKIPLQKYTQILVNESEAQEKNGFSVIGKSFVDPILIDPSEDWAIVHELAHQWWGNLLTCKSWDHFWLNEGIVVFMTAAYKQYAWGQPGYQHEMGDINFWKGFKEYTIKNQFRSVVTADFQKSMQDNTDKDLRKIFSKWVN